MNRTCVRPYPPHTRPASDRVCGGCHSLMFCSHPIERATCGLCGLLHQSAWKCFSCVLFWHPHSNAHNAADPSWFLYMLLLVMCLSYNFAIACYSCTRFGIYKCMKLMVVSWQTAASPFDQTIGCSKPRLLCNTVLLLRTPVRLLYR